MAKLSAHGRYELARVVEPLKAGSATVTKALMSDGNILSKLRYTDGSFSGWTIAQKVGAEYLDSFKRVPKSIEDKWLATYINMGWTQGKTKGR